MAIPHYSYQTIPPWHIPHTKFKFVAKQIKLKKIQKKKKQQFKKIKKKCTLN